MQPIKTNQNQKFPADLELPVQPVLHDKGIIYGHKINEKRLSVSIPVPGRTHQQFVQRQQYYTGDA
jgi:hypothetical protein